MSIGIQKTFNLDMVPGGAPPVIHVSAGDVGRPFRAVLLYNGEVYTLEYVTSVKIRGTKPDNTVFEYALTFDDEDSHVDFVIEEQMAIIAGQVLCEIRLFSGDDTIGSANFILDVETAVYDPEAASESYVPQIEDAINEAIENVADTITEAATEGAIDSVKQYADDAEAWATGSVDGTDVTSTADQYHNNAKYYAEQAGEKATAAAGSATDAAASAAEAMSGTPDGYAALVNTVNKLDSISYISGESVPINLTATGWRLVGPPSNGCSPENNAILRKYEVTAGEVLYLKLSDAYLTYDNRATYQFQSNSSVPGGANANIVGEAVKGAVDGFVTVPTGATWLIVCEEPNTSGNEVKKAVPVKNIANTLITEATTIGEETGSNTYGDCSIKYIKIGRLVNLHAEFTPNTNINTSSGDIMSVTDDIRASFPVKTSVVNKSNLPDTSGSRSAVVNSAIYYYGAYTAGTTYSADFTYISAE